VLASIFFHGNLPAIGFLVFSFAIPVAWIFWPRVGIIPFAISQILWFFSRALPVLIRPLFESDYGVQLSSLQLTYCGIFSIVYLIGLSWLGLHVKSNPSSLG
jgi:hypothetical protein